MKGSKDTLDPVVGRVRCILHGAHDWRVNGGRQCPHGCPSCSQTVYQCARCGAWDYGEAGGPAYAECNQCTANATPRRRSGKTGREFER